MDALPEETERLRRSWMQHPQEFLRDYFVQGIHDPLLNPQSIQARHHLVRAAFPGRFGALMEEEVRHAATVRWLEGARGAGWAREDWQVLLHALEKGVDDAEGMPIPEFVTAWISRLPATLEGRPVRAPVLEIVRERAAGTVSPTAPVATEGWARLWREVLDREAPAALGVLEPACGSANDYRGFVATGLARHLRYVGVDLCPKNIANARMLHPEADFLEGNVFDLPFDDDAFDEAVVHDLFEHLSPAGLEQALDEVARVARSGLFLAFFQMHEEADHVIRPVDEYHWNLLSLARVRSALERKGWATRADHVATWWRWHLGPGAPAYYETAYDLEAWRPAPHTSQTVTA